MRASCFIQAAAILAAVAFLVGSPSSDELRRATAAEDLDAPRAPGSGAIEQRISYALEMAGRGAIYTARAELVRALATLAQARDAEGGTQESSRAMDAGLTALREAADFVPAGEGSAATVDVARAAVRHRTPVLKETPADRLNPAFALQSYHAYAVEQLARAGGHNPLASKILTSLGRLESAAASGPVRGTGAAAGMALHQAALVVNRRNYEAANELAVLQARYGRLEEARDLLLHSLSVSPCLESWHNLAVVCERLGDRKGAQEARQQCTNMRRDQAASAGGTQDGTVCWLDAKTFAAQSGEPEPGALLSKAKTPLPATPPPADAPVVKKDLVSLWLSGLGRTASREESSARQSQSGMAR